MIGLGGGGSEYDEKNVWDKIFKDGQSITIWPFAQPQQRWDVILNWVTSALAPRGKFSITIGDRADYGLSTADVIFIPGGNTFELLDYMRKHRLVQGLSKFIDAGGSYYGGSAGAVLMGSDISIVDLALGGLDENTVGMDDTSGVNYLRGHALYPHYEEHEPGCVKLCRTWAAERGVVIAVPENGGILIDKDGKAYNAGPAEIFLFKPDGDVVRIEESLVHSILETSTGVGGE